MPGVSDEQVHRAREIPILHYLQTHEPHNLRKCGAGRYCLKDHDSLIISNDRWNWFSRGFGGHSALDFLIKVRDVDFIEAVRLLNDDYSPTYKIEHSEPKQPPKRFVLPPAHGNNDRVIAYLRGRGISMEQIKHCLENGSLYESAEHHSCVFVGFDGSTPRFACERSTTGDYKRDVSGSNKRFGFIVPPQKDDCKNLIVTESPIDALAHVTINQINGSNWDGYRLSLGGVSSLALISFLERHQTIENIRLCLDNDKAGKDAQSRILKELLGNQRFSHLRLTVSPPPLGKDYADTLEAILQMNKEQTRTGRQHMAAISI